MSFVPVEEFKDRNSIPLAPMLDFLFLLLAFFVSLSTTRTNSDDTSLELARAKGDLNAQIKQGEKIIHIAVLASGEYLWATKQRNHQITTAKEIADELRREYAKGLLPEDKKKTLVLLKIDKNATWEPILNALIAIRDCGFEAKPLYVPER